MFKDTAELYCQYNSYHLPDFYVRTIITVSFSVILHTDIIVLLLSYLRPTGLSFTEDGHTYKCRYDQNEKNV